MAKLLNHSAVAGWSGEHSIKRLDLILSNREVNVKFQYLYLVVITKM
jgi:hypothetical protein